MRLVLHRYIFAELLKTFVLSTAAITLFLSLANALGTLRERGLGPIDSAHLILYFIPAMLVFAMPIGALLTTTLVFGRLASDNEITACRASGISTGTLLKPVFVLGLTIGAITFLLHDRVIPWARYRVEAVGTENIERIFFHRLRIRGEDEFSTPSGSIYISAKRIDGNMLYGVVLKQQSPSGKGFVTYAPAARIEFLPVKDGSAGVRPVKTPAESPAPRAGAADPGQGEARKSLTAEQVAAGCWDAEVVSYGSIFIKLFKFYMVTDDRTSIARGDQGVIRALTFIREKEADQMTLGQLLHCYRNPQDTYDHKIAVSRGAGEEALKSGNRKTKARCLAEMHGRYAMIVTCVLLVVLGAVLGLVFRHGHILTAFFISMGPALFAIFCILLGTRMVRSNPADMHSFVFLVWMGNAVVLVIDALFVGRMVRR